MYVKNPKIPETSTVLVVFNSAEKGKITLEVRIVQLLLFSAISSE